MPARIEVGRKGFRSNVQSLVKPEKLHEPTSLTPGVVVQLSVANPKFNCKKAVVLRGVDDDERVNVFVQKIGAYIRVKSHALVPVKGSAGVPWWQERPARGFPYNFEIAVVHSRRVTDFLCKLGLSKPQLVVVEECSAAVPFKCHMNAHRCACEGLGTAVFGYSLLPSFTCQCVTFEAHSVLRKGDGRLVDVTPDWGDEVAKFFVEEMMFDYDAYCEASLKGIPVPTGGPINPIPNGTSASKTILPCGCEWCPNEMSADEVARHTVVPDGLCKRDVCDAIANTKFTAREEIVKMFPKSGNHARSV